uniref:START domain-containing protein 10 n=1 Tax=Lepisosteus oculatus TaxID=7918 RepID=W5NDI8_LEPOC|nr:PREDICTED: PCTP-like protein [Lepisosteus oculatus]XP_015207268.1 PREDICTED: PCTP-like protein [Lepisosteus oculatus]XP_015207269.1 PREDICTED: PCTP-like protein [Lepisosteus oculatus]
MASGSAVVPDDSVFSDFRRQCQSKENWVSKYRHGGMEVWVEVAPVPAAQDRGKNHVSKVHKIKCKMTINDVSAATMYDVLHDGAYRKKWDPTVLESYDIARITDNADVGYYSWICPKPLKNRDVVTLRAWQVKDNAYMIINYSVKHPKYPPRKDLVRAISILTGYLLEPTGPDSCTFTYLSQADPKGSLPKWVVNKASQYLAPKVLKCVHKAGQQYPEWKKHNSPDKKPWYHPEQSTLPSMEASELAIQRGESLENVDESGVRESRENEEAEDSS